MKVSLSWLKEYVPVNMETSVLADAMTMAGLEVEAVEDRHEYLKDVIVARIEKIAKHPNADKLQVCEVNNGSGSVQVVCGAQNIYEGMTVPLAQPGCELPGGIKLKAGKIRGEKSEGMLCSAVELGLGDSASGIMDIDKELILGEPVNTALDLMDPVFEIGLTPNRPDCLSISGIAREVAVFQDLAVTIPVPDKTESGNKINELTSVTIEAPELCPRYAAKMILDIKVGPSPFWLKDRLSSLGMTPVNNIVDITNFVMLETGQPLHAFDYDKLEEGRIVVKQAKEGEKFTTLDGKEHALSSEMLMICDGKKSIALAGVMGGENSEIDDSTTKVLLESAYFKPTSIRKTSKKLTINTDATHRFERGIDPEGTDNALYRAAQLIAELGEGTIVDGVIDERPVILDPVALKLSTKDTNRLLGLSLTRDEISNYLKSVHFTTSVIDEDTLEVSAPPFRVDVSRPVDLMEEVARLSGYNNIPTTYPLIPAKSLKPSHYIGTRSRVKSCLNGFGFFEAINYSFISASSSDRICLPENDTRRNVVEILNPLTEDQAVMRSSLIPGLLEAVQRNISRQEKNLKLFETGKIFINNGNGGQPQENEMLAVLWTGSRDQETWHGKVVDCDFFDLKGVTEGLLDGLNINDASFSKLDESSCIYTKKGYSASIIIGDETIGLIGEVSPLVTGNFNIKQKVYIAEIDLARLISLCPEDKSSQPIPKFPPVTRDITMICNASIESGTIISWLESLDENLLENTLLFDVYEGDSVPEGKRSISIRLTYRSYEKTLKDKAVNKIHNKIMESMLKEFDGALPS